MDQSAFIKRLTDQFKGMIEGAKRQAQKEIEGNLGKMDTAGFSEWLKSEQQAALSEPALQVYDHVKPQTPEIAAQNLAGTIALGLGGNVKWKDQFQKAEPILTNWKTEKSEGWKYKGYLVQYIKAFSAETRARVFSQRIEQAWPPNTHVTKLDKDEKESLEFRRDVIKRGESYFALWDECKDLFADPNLPEEQFIRSDIDHCEEEIERWKDSSHSFRDSWTGILKACIRAHRQRLDEIKKTQQIQEEPLTFERLFKGKNEMEVAVLAIQGTIFDATKRPHVRAFYKAAVNCKLIKDRRGKEKDALPLIALQFGGHCHGNATYQVEPNEKIVDILVRRMHAVSVKT